MRTDGRTGGRLEWF